jgi:hypothetical protein
MRMRTTCLWLLVGTVLASLPEPATAQWRLGLKSDRIDIAYVAPKNSAHQRLHELLRQHRVLERMQEILKPFRLPRRLALKIEGCDGDANAWYESDAITVCYEYLDQIGKNAPKETTASGIAPVDALVGPLFDVFFHEAGHALFDMLRIPILGREEDAADQVSAYLMLRLGKGEARRLIAGAAYIYKGDLQEAFKGNPQEAEVVVPVTRFSDQHGHPVQRFYNLVCIAYGSDPKLFADVVTKGYLPKERAEGCEGEYEQAVYAFDRLIAPYVDRRAARKLHAMPKLATERKQPERRSDR